MLWIMYRKKGELCCYQHFGPHDYAALMRVKRSARRDGIPVVAIYFPKRA